MKVFWSVIALASLGASAEAATGIGTKAPSLKVAAYVKGARVNLAKGIHVVDFWATWCAPCRAAIPDLTKLARRYAGKVDFTGVSVNEEGPDKIGQVKSFVKRMGSAMAYNVAIDTESKFMYSKWMEAVGMQTLPVTFVVKNGVVVWIGPPSPALGEALRKVLSGKLSLAQAKLDFEEVKADSNQAVKTQSEQEQAMIPFQMAREAGDADAALKALDEVAKQYPSLKPQLVQYRAQMLIMKGDRSGYALGESLVAAGQFKDNPDLMGMLAWTIVEPTPAAKTPDYAYALRMAKRAVEVQGGSDPSLLDTYALSLFKSGDREKAIKIETKAVSLLHAGGDPDALKEYSRRLAEFKKS